MRDIHCHILPGVDDGARSLAESMEMLEAAKAQGITSIVCTPHCRDPFFDYEAMRRSFAEFSAHANGFPLTMGFEVYHDKLMELGLAWAERLAYAGTDEVLLELSTGADEYAYRTYERTIFELRGMGYTVVIAHPERYRAVQHDTGIAERLVGMGCKLCASADFMAAGPLSRVRRTAAKLFDRGLYSYIASDAHRPAHYGYLAKARKRFRLAGEEHA